MQWTTGLNMLVVQLFFIVSIIYDADAQIKVYDSEHRRVEVVFNSTQTQRDLDQFQQTMIEYGIVLKYDSVAFDQKGRLESIEFSVDCRDGFSGGAKTTGLRKDSRFGFFRDYTADATVSMVAFAAGDLDGIATSRN